MDGPFEKMTGWHVRRGNTLYHIAGKDSWEANRDLARLLDWNEELDFDETPVYYINGEFTLDLPAHLHVILNEKWEMRNHCPFFLLDRDFTRDDNEELLTLLRGPFWRTICVCSAYQKFDPTNGAHIQAITEDRTEEVAEYKKDIESYSTFEEFMMR